MNPPSLALVINAGGQSRRMGRNKALLPMPAPKSANSNPLIVHMIQRLAVLPVERLVVVSGDAAVRDALFRQRLSVPLLSFVADAYAGGGALGGLATGLRECPAWGIVVACDMPLINPHLLLWQWQQIAGAARAETEAEIDALVPVVSGRAQPFHALYHHRCLPAIVARLAAGQRKVTSFLADVRTRYIPEAVVRARDPHLRSFRNVNTPAEWLAVSSQLSSS